MSDNFLFIYTDFQIGGIQTQILEQCRCINESGAHVKVLLLTREFDKELLLQLESVAEVKFFDELTKYNNVQNKIGVKGLLFYLLFPHQHIANDFFKNITYCHVSNLIGYLYCSILLSKGYLHSIIISFGLYHSGEIKIFDGDSRFVRKLLASLKFFPSTNIISTGAVTQEEIAGFYGQDSLTIKLLKMGVPLPTVFKNKKRGDCFKIISIGRLVDFKTYNLIFLDNIFDKIFE